ncbi:Oidioi.mRNA.OKI2018_I69.chr1.g3925.t1.cds [Oikopleura dioica]|uniref:Oidioi.mRNA.OKI2018_I69.chr1.g3925.t1.cds n=1 Tax=Oikopleura dioica TaxID=34765 RepID=A0ABN7SVK4_OIKDI|nr:Oidioi.mRNA.OKI2018_I69.chr1.g3925.t1.cds [Oikopleura dioica]
MVMNMAEGQIDYNGPQHRPKLQRNQKRNTSELEDEFDNLDDENAENRPSTPTPTLGRGSRRPSLTSSRPTSPSRESESSLGPSFDSPLATWTYPYLPWKPKVTLSEIDDFVRMARSKYLDYSFKYPKTEAQMLAAVQNRFGLPKPTRTA